MSVPPESGLYEVLNVSIYNWQQSVHALVDCKVGGGGDTGITLRSKQDPIRPNWWLMSKELVLYCDYCGLRPLSS